MKSKLNNISEQVILQWVHDSHWAITLALFCQHQKKKNLLVVIEGETSHPYISEFKLNVKEVKTKHQVNKKMTSQLWSEINSF